MTAQASCRFMSVAERCRTGTRRRAPRRRPAGSAARVAPTRIADRPGPFPIFARLGVRQGRPVCRSRFLPPPGVPGRDSPVEIAGPVDLVGPGGELVDHRRVEGVPALLRALGVAVVSAPPTEEVACEPLAIGAATASAFGRKRRPPSAATGGPAVQARLAGVRVLPVLLDRARPPAAFHRARGDGSGERRRPDESRRQCSAPLGDEKLKVHGVAPVRVVVDAVASVAWTGRPCARRPVTSRQRGRSVRRTEG